MLVTQICTLCLSYKVDKNSFTFAILFSLTTFKQPIENNTKDMQKVGLTHNQETMALQILQPLICSILLYERTLHA